MYPCLIPQTMRSELYDNVDIRVEIEVDDVSRYVCMYNVDLKRRGWGVDGCEPWLRSIDIRGFDRGTYLGS